jgi:hypothetical protein
MFIPSYHLLFLSKKEFFFNVSQRAIFSGLSVSSVVRIKKTIYFGEGVRKCPFLTKMVNRSRTMRSSLK